MKAIAYLSFIGFVLILLLTSAKPANQTNYKLLKKVSTTSIADGVYFNPQKFYNKQCTFCHNDKGRMGPPMGKIKEAYIKIYPNKKDFVEKMTLFVLKPIDENRLIVNNKGKYKVMPEGMFFDKKKIQKVAEYIYDHVEVPVYSLKTEPDKSLLPKNKNKGKAKIYNVNIGLAKGADICKIMNLHAVDFDYAQSKVNAKMAKQLDMLVVFLKANPEIKIEIRNYTDARGTAKHNLELSNKRAQAIRTYLLKKGILSTRVRAKGYGETRLLNHCKDGVKCTEKQHSQNRRTEIVII